MEKSGSRIRYGKTLDPGSGINIPHPQHIIYYYLSYVNLTAFCLDKHSRLTDCFSHNQCCRTVMIYCGSGSDFGKLLVPVPDPNNIWHSFPNKKNWHKILPFQCQKQQHYFPESWPPSFDLLTFFIPFIQTIAQFFNKILVQKSCLFNVRNPRKSASHIRFVGFFLSFYVGSRSKSGSGIRTGTIMQSGSGSAKTKSYGSCGSGHKVFKHKQSSHV
jgi:hypothetical protein